MRNHFASYFEIFLKPSFYMRSVHLTIIKLYFMNFMCCCSLNWHRFLDFMTRLGRVLPNFRCRPNIEIVTMGLMSLSTFSLDYPEINSQAFGAVLLHQMQIDFYMCNVTVIRKQDDHLYIETRDNPWLKHIVLLTGL